MAIELKQQLKLSQQLVMTPQLQQAIKLLQLSRLELVNLVQQELQENPVLEDLREGEEELPAEVSKESEADDAAPADASSDASENREPTDAEKVADIDWQNYMDAYPQTGLSVQRDDDERRSLEATLTRRPTLAEHLQWQVQLSGLSDAEKEAATWIIGNLDEHGYFRGSIEDVARQSGMAPEVVEEGLRKVQGLDPAGVAARDLRECLLIQIGTLGIEDPLVHALVGEHLDELQKRDFRKIAKAVGASVEAVAAAAKVIARLEPRPGRAYGGDEPIYITPDIYVYKVGDDYHILLNEDGLPKLRINNLYRGVLSRDKDVAKDTRDYVQDKVRAAMWLIKSIHQRQRTIYKVMQSIIKHQREFFEHGINHLKPLNLRDVAEDIEMHESTVSRVVSNKYIHTSRGLFPLKFFFHSGIDREYGGDISSLTVKRKIKQLIQEENSRKPLSDSELMRILNREGIQIARRTVAKYRDELGIPSSTDRKQIF